MTEITITLPDKLAAQIGGAKIWMPTIMEIALTGFRTKTAESASDLVKFLEKNPSPDEVLSYHASKKSHDRLYRLKALSEAALLSSEERNELRELEKLEHLVVMLKAQAGKILNKKS